MYNVKIIHFDFVILKLLYFRDVHQDILNNNQ